MRIPCGEEMQSICNRILKEQISTYIPYDCCEIAVYKITGFSVRNDHSLRFRKENWSFIKEGIPSYICDDGFIEEKMRDTLFGNLSNIVYVEDVEEAIKMACDSLNSMNGTYFIQNCFLDPSFYLFLMVVDKKVYYETMEEQFYICSDNDIRVYPFIDKLLNNIFALVKEACSTYPINIKKKLQNLELQAVDALLEEFSIPNRELLLCLSALKYETSENKSNMVFLKKDEIEGEGLLKFIHPIALNIENGRKLRKYMEMATGDYSLVIVEGRVVALWKKSKTYRAFCVQFNGYLNWKLTYSDLGIIEFRGGRYQLPPINREWCCDIEKCVYPLSEQQKKRLIYCVGESCKQKHGTTVIITEDVKGECDRLCALDRGIAIDPIDLYKFSEYIKQITAIDGAVLIDRNCVCYGIGVILDGTAIIKGTSSRGARYNSARNYVEVRKRTQNKMCMAVIISEDEMVNIIE